MHIHFDIKPKLMSFEYKKDIYDYLRSCGYHLTFMSNTFTSGGHSDLHVYCKKVNGSNHYDVILFNCEKHKRKHKIMKDGTRKLIRKAKWIVRFYNVPSFVIRRAKQKARYFEYAFEFGNSIFCK